MAATKDPNVLQTNNLPGAESESDHRLCSPSVTYLRSPPKTVSFSSVSEVRLFDRPTPEPNRRPGKSRMKMSEQLTQVLDGQDVTDEMLHEAAQLFSHNYGVWSSEAAKHVGPFAKPECFRHTSEDEPISSPRPMPACLNIMLGKVVCWVTQLVVDRDYRERGLASNLLNALKQDSDDIYGIVSSHAAACMAAANVYRRGIHDVSLDFIRDHAKAIMKASPVSYVKDAKPSGKVFDPAVINSTVSCVDTGFYVDHTEPLEALDRVREDNTWPLGELIDGHEFLLVLEAKRARSKPRSRA